jgi:hypothetical protein
LGFFATIGGDELPDDPAFHFGGRLSGEGDGEDLGGGEPFLDDVAEVSRGEHGRFAGSGGGGDREPVERGFDSGSLFGGELDFRIGRQVMPP